MQEKKYNLVKALSWYTIGNVLIKSINFFTLRVFTELIDSSNYGVYGIYQSYLSIFELLILFGTVHTIKMVKYDEKIEYDKYISSILCIPIIGMLILLLVTWIVSRFTGIIAGLSEDIWYAIFLTAGFSAIGGISMGKLVLDGKYKVFIVYSLLNTVINIGVSLALCHWVYIDDNVYWARIIGCLTANFVSSFFSLHFLRFSFPRLFYIKRAIIWGAPLLIHSIATQILVQTDKILIGQLATYSAVGIYTAATSIAVIPNTFVSSIEHSWSPWFYQELASENFDKIRKRNSKILSFYGMVLIMFILGCHDVVRIMTNREYWDATFVVIPLAASSFAELVYLIPLNFELFHKKNGEIWIYTVIAVFVNIVFDYIGIELFGYLAGAWVTCATRFLLFGLHYLRAKRIKNEIIVDIRIVFLIVAIMILSCIISIKLRDNVVIRWLAILALIGFFLLRFYKDILKDDRNIV